MATVRLNRKKREALPSCMCRMGLLLLLLFMLIPLPASGREPTPPVEQCTTCHKEEGRFSPTHPLALLGCTGCHNGNPLGETKAEAHAKMDTHPGGLANLENTCGRSQCHTDLIKPVRNSIMNTLDGMIELTRSALGAPPRDDRHKPLGERLAQNGVDSYLRKMCVSCHLGTKQQNHTFNFADRGGGCNACHLQRHVEGASANQVSRSVAKTDKEKQVRTGIHPTLTLVISNKRCFGCHSRSGRISLNYVGLAEIQHTDRAPPKGSAQIYDGRLVQRRVSDLHAKAGLSCIDCHTGTGLMGHGERVQYQQAQVDIGCDDCHASKLREAEMTTLPWKQLARPLLHGWQTPDLKRGRLVVTAKRGSPLYNLYRQKNGTRMLRSKVQPGEVVVPVRKAGPHHDLAGHDRLTCQACHAAWAPQCDGCHISYDGKGKQYDHLLQKVTPGRWIEKSWSVRSDPPALGVRADGKISPFVPGMSLVLEPPRGGEALRRVMYSRIAPHTTQAKSRTCESCHSNESAMGVIVGEAVAPWDSGLKLPLGWVEKDAQVPAPGLHPGDRSFDQGERERIRLVGRCLACHPGQTPWYTGFGKAITAIGSEKNHLKKFQGKQPK